MPTGDMSIHLVQPKIDEAEAAIFFLSAVKESNESMSVWRCLHPNDHVLDRTKLLNNKIPFSRHGFSHINKVRHCRRIRQCIHLQHGLHTVQSQQRSGHWVSCKSPCKPRLKTDGDSTCHVWSFSTNEQQFSRKPNVQHYLSGGRVVACRHDSECWVIRRKTTSYIYILSYSKTKRSSSPIT